MKNKIRIFMLNGAWAVQANGKVDRFYVTGFRGACLWARRVYYLGPM